jgi:hypothetical protein
VIKKMESMMYADMYKGEGFPLDFSNWYPMISLARLSDNILSQLKEYPSAIAFIIGTHASMK